MKKIVWVILGLSVFLKLIYCSNLYAVYENKINFDSNYELELIEKVNKNIIKQENVILDNKNKLKSDSNIGNEKVESDINNKGIVSNNYEKYGVIFTQYNDGNKQNSYYKINRENYKAGTDELTMEANELTKNNIAIANNILNMVNELRANLNINKLVLDDDLTLSANIRAIELAYSNKLEHTRPNNLKWFSVLDDLKIKYGYAGENIGWYYKLDKDVMEAWTKSQGHYQNMVNLNYQKLGVGYIKLNNENYWVQIFSD